MTYRKPSKLTCKVNKDYSVSILHRGKVVHKYESTASSNAIESTESYLKGWFNGAPIRVRWTLS